jgi:hypothetical protein
MSGQVDADKRLHGQEGLLDLWRKPSYRKRMICAFVTMFASESSGILVIYSKISSLKAMEIIANNIQTIASFCTLALVTLEAFHSCCRPPMSLALHVETISALS